MRLLITYGGPKATRFRPIIDIDQVFYWTTIRKNRLKYSQTRGLSEDDITKILLRDIICQKDAAKAEAAFLKLPGLRKFVDRLRHRKEKDDFTKHLRKYINMWNMDCAFEVCTTNRYTINTHEAAVKARREIKKGEIIKYLCGTLVAITPNEEKELDLTRRDFSIVMSSRKKTPSLFLGPARFANHDCNANARLSTVGMDSMQVVATRHIAKDEEITVTYGEDYFGRDNCECLCATCESLCRNGWTPPSPQSARQSTTPAIHSEPDTPYHFRRKRRLGGSDFGSPALTPDVEERPLKRTRSAMAIVETINHKEPLVEPPSSQLKRKFVEEEGFRKSEIGEFRPPEKGSISPEVHNLKIPPKDHELSTQAFPADVTEEPNSFTGEAVSRPIEARQSLDQDPLGHESALTSRRPNTEDYRQRRGSSQEKQFKMETRVDAGESEDTVAIKIITPEPQPASPVIDRLRKPEIVSSQGSIDDGSDADSIFEVDLIKTADSPVSTPSNSHDGRGTVPEIAWPALEPAPHEEFPSSRFPIQRCGAPVPDPPVKVEDVEEPPNAIPILTTETMPFLQSTPDDPELPTINDPELPTLNDSDDDLSSLASNEDFDDANACIIRKRKPPLRRGGPKKKKALSKLAVPSVETTAAKAFRPPPSPPAVRRPGDHVRPPSLLAEPCARFVTCGTCAGVWAQANGYYTRRECPRCERHSMLYGFRWPQTERVKGGPERVMDHRTVHRFLRPEEEKGVRRRESGVAPAGLTTC